MLNFRGVSPQTNGYEALFLRQGRVGFSDRRLNRLNRPRRWPIWAVIAFQVASLLKVRLGLFFPR